MINNPFDTQNNQQSSNTEELLNQRGHYIKDYMIRTIDEDVDYDEEDNLIPFEVKLILNNLEMYRMSTNTGFIREPSLPNAEHFAAIQVKINQLMKDVAEFLYTPINCEKIQEQVELKTGEVVNTIQYSLRLYIIQEDVLKKLLTTIFSKD